ncbi:MAG: hypothetical protein ACJA0X_000264 [Cyclobacteriaceae bacterium]|jgi:hypothetical protein
MKFQVFVWLILLNIFWSCQQSIPKKLLRSQVLELHRKDALVYTNAQLIDTLGQAKWNTIDFNKEVVYEFFIDEAGAVSQVMEVPIQSFEDEIYAIQMRLIPTFEPSAHVIPFDCDTMKEALRNAGILDQQIRRGEVDRDLKLVDDYNQKLVVTSIAQCGFPLMEEVGKLALGSIWIILQHSDKKMLAYYYQDLEKAVYHGSLNLSNFNMTLDRMLMFNNYPQVYGTQYQYGKFYKLRNPDQLNGRRIASGMRPFDKWELENIVGITP